MHFEDREYVFAFSFFRNKFSFRLKTYKKMAQPKNTKKFSFRGCATSVDLSIHLTITLTSNPYAFHFLRIHSLQRQQANFRLLKQIFIHELTDVMR